MISIVITPGRCTSLGGSGLGVPRVPPPEPAFPYAPGHLGGLGSAMNPVDPLASPPGARGPVPRVAGVILPAPAWFAGAGGVCRLLPCGSRGWRGVHGLTPRRAPSAVRGGAMGRLRWDGPRHRGLLLRTVWATPPSALELRASTEYPRLAP